MAVFNLEEAVDEILIHERKAQNDANHRGRSWVHCYCAFHKAIAGGKEDFDYLSLQLAFYLASWGMYRASSFLLERDYLVHKPVVEKILDPKYKCLLGITCKDLVKLIANDENPLNELSGFIKSYYFSQREKVKLGKGESNPISEISSTLITKILLGTLGCVPAYDRYFATAIKRKGVASGTYGKKSLRKLAEFYEQNYSKLEEARKEFGLSDKSDGQLECPQMKLLDIIFWNVGINLDRS